MNHHQGLVVAYNSARLVDIDADYIELGLEVYADVNLTVDLDAAGNGAGKLDTGSAAVSTWYFVWAIGNVDGDVPSYSIDGMLSLSSTAPSMPDNYAEKLLLGQVYNDASGNILPFRHTGKRWSYTANIYVSVNGTAASITYSGAVVAARVPATSTEAIMRLAHVHGTAGIRGVMTRAHGDTGPAGGWHMYQNAIAHADTGDAYVLLDTSQQFNWLTTDANGTVYIYTKAYYVPYS